MDRYGNIRKNRMNFMPWSKLFVRDQKLTFSDVKHERDGSAMAMNDNFYDHLSFGKAAESLIARYFMRCGYVINPIYEIIINEGKGPQLFTMARSLVAPDLLITKPDHLTAWIEAKHKTGFTWHRITGRWVTGIDLRHYEDYLRVEEITPWPVWLLFLQEGGQTKDSPVDSPAGLFGNGLHFLRQNENHRSGKWGKSGMVYWAQIG